MSTRCCFLVLLVLLLPVAWKTPLPEGPLASLNVRRMAAARDRPSASDELPITTTASFVAASHGAAGVRRFYAPLPTCGAAGQAHGLGRLLDAGALGASADSAVPLGQNELAL